MALFLLFPGLCSIMFVVASYRSVAASRSLLFVFALYANQINFT